MTPPTPALPEALAALFTRADELAAQLDAPLSAAPDVPRPEHPRPQLQRPTWLNLNGTWQFEIDRGDTGRERGLLGRAPVMPVHAFSSAAFIRRGGRIPAPLNSLKN